MNIKVYEPSEVSGEMALVLTNHLGSTIDQDAGRDAQVFANALKIPVLAFNRPGTGGFLWDNELASRLSTPRGYVGEYTEIGRTLDRQLESLGIDGVIIAGRSAAGLGALALTMTETISDQRAVVVAEPVGCEDLDVTEAKEVFKAYAPKQKEWQEGGLVYKPEGGNQLSVGQEITRRVAMVRDYLIDKHHNQYIWSSDASAYYLSILAARNQDLIIRADFAEYSLVAREVPEDGVDTFRDALEPLNGKGHNISITRSEGMSHASYDDSNVMLGLINPVIEQVQSH